MKRIIFMGTPTFGAYILKQLLDAHQDVYEVVAVISQPDKAVGRKQVMQHTPVKEVALQYNLPILQPVKIGAVYDELVELAPDLIITAAYGQIVPKSILDLPTDKCINIHGSLLPKYRGGAPIQRAIMAGDQETGITIMYMAEKMDAGDMLAQVVVPIGLDDTQGTMFAKLAEAGAELLLKMLPSFFQHELNAQAQDQTEVTYAPIIKRADCKIDWAQDAQTIFNQVRGLTPNPATFISLGGEQIKLFQVEIVAQETNEEPGTIITVDTKRCYVATRSGVIALMDLQLNGKKRQTIAEFMGGSGRKLFVVGAQFES